MGASKGVLLSGVALIVGIYATGIHNADAIIASTAGTHVYQLQSEANARTGVSLALDDMKLGDWSTRSRTGYFMGDTLRYDIEYIPNTKPRSAKITSLSRYEGFETRMVAYVEERAIAPSDSAPRLKTVTTGNLVFDSWTPTKNLLTILMIAQREELVVASVAGNNLTWTLVRDKDAARGMCGVQVWQGVGSSPTTGTTTVTLPSNGSSVAGIIQQFRGTGTTTPIEAIGVDTKVGTNPADDNMNMLASVTTVSANAWAVACGASHEDAIFTVPGSDTAAISINLWASAGGGPNRVLAHMWYDGPVVTPGSKQLGALGDLNKARDWAVVVVSMKPATADTTAIVSRRGRRIGSTWTITKSYLVPNTNEALYVAE